MNNWDEAIKEAFEERYSPPPELYQKLEAASNAKAMRNIRLLSLCAVFFTVIVTLLAHVVVGATALFFVSIVSLIFVAFGSIVIVVLCPQLIKEQARR